MSDDQQANPGGPAALIEALAAIEQRLAIMRLDVARPLNLTANDTRVLTALTEAGGRAQVTRLAELVGAHTGTMTTMIDRLAQAGLVVRTANSADRRSVIVELTHQGDQIIAANRRRLTAAITCVATEADIAQTTATLNLLAERLANAGLEFTERAADRY